MSKTKKPIDDTPINPAVIDERGPTTEWGRRTAFEVGDTGRITALQGPVERAVARGTLTHRQGRAAARLYELWYNCGLRGTAGSADPLKVFGTGMDPSRLGATDWGVAQLQKLTGALDEVEKRADDNGSRKDHARRVLVGIVCEERTFADVGECIGFPAKAAEVMARTILKSGLNVLIKRWSL